MSMNVREAADRIREGYRRGECFPIELTGRLSFAEALSDDLAVGCGVEPELCVTMGADLCGPGATPGQARTAVESIAPGMEIEPGRMPIFAAPVPGRGPPGGGRFAGAGSGGWRIQGAIASVYALTP